MRKRVIFFIALLVLSFIVLVYARSFDSGKLVLDNNYNNNQVRGEIISSNNLSVGDIFYLDDGRKARVTGVEDIASDFNFDNLNFFANGVLVHNKWDMNAPAHHFASEITETFDYTPSVIVSAKGRAEMAQVVGEMYQARFNAEIGSAMNANPILTGESMQQYIQRLINEGKIENAGMAIHAPKTKEAIMAGEGRYLVFKSNKEGLCNVVMYEGMYKPGTSDVASAYEAVHGGKAVEAGMLGVKGNLGLRGEDQLSREAQLWLDIIESSKKAGYSDVDIVVAVQPRDARTYLEVWGEYIEPVSLDVLKEIQKSRPGSEILTYTRLGRKTGGVQFPYLLEKEVGSLTLPDGTILSGMESPIGTAVLKMKKHAVDAYALKELAELAKGAK